MSLEQRSTYKLGHLGGHSVAHLGVLRSFGADELVPLGEALQFRAFLDGQATLSGGPGDGVRF